MTGTHPGRTAARFLKALAVAGSSSAALDGFLEGQRWGDAAVIRSAVGAHVFSDWASGGLATVGADFMATVRPQTVLGRLLERRLVRALPPGVPTIRQTQGAAASWTVEGDAVAMAAQAFTRDARMALKRVGAITVATHELIGVEGSEDVLLTDLAAACAEAIDSALLDPDNGGDSATPASPLNGAASIMSSGDAAEDLGGLLAVFPGRFDRAFFATDPATAAALALRLPSSAISLVGDAHLLGRPLLVSGAVPADTSGSVIALIDGSRLQVAGLAQAELSLSREASIVMDTAPSISSTTPTAAEVVSLMQTNSVGLLAIAFVNWRAHGGAAFISGANYEAGS